MWAAIKRALNSTLGTSKFKALDDIAAYRAHDAFYNTMASYVAAYGDNEGAIAVVPYGTQETYALLSTYPNAKVLVLPSTVKTLKTGTALSLLSLTDVVLPPSLTTIEEYFSRYNNTMKTITLPKSVTSVSETAFSDMTALTDIYCEFAEGAVAGAPWGATNATVHYI